jgi:hypothetical protein
MDKHKKSDIYYINIDIDSDNKLGKKLALESTFNAISTLIGKITSLRTALDYIVTPNYPSKLLTKGKLNAKDIISIPTEKVWITNYWAIVTHLAFERIYQDKTLLNEIVGLKGEVEFISFKSSENKTSGLSSKVINYNKDMGNYIMIIDNIVKNIRLHQNDENKLLSAIKILILNTKTKSDLGLFHNVPFNIEFDDKQLNN